MNKYFRYPVEYVGISQRWKDGSHYGIDFGWNSKYLPMKIFPAANGTVTIADWSAAIGWYIVIYHGVKDGKDIYTQYKHLESKPMVSVGQAVKMTQQIGVMGATGYECDGRHLHFDYIPIPQGKPFTQSYRINPAPFLYAFTDMVIGVKGQDGVQIQKQNMTVAQACETEIDPPKPQPTPAVYYTVQKGDTLYKIAKAYGITLEKLLSMNPQIKNPSLIYPGDKVVVKEGTEPTPEPTKKTYTVQKGDTLYKIAKAYGMTLEQLLAKNPQIKNASLIYPGDKINV